MHSRGFSIMDFVDNIGLEPWILHKCLVVTLWYSYRGFFPSLLRGRRWQRLGLNQVACGGKLCAKEGWKEEMNMLDIQFLAASLFSISYLYFEKRNSRREARATTKKVGILQHFGFLSCAVEEPTTMCFDNADACDGMHCRTVWVDNNLVLWRSRPLEKLKWVAARAHVALSHARNSFHFQ